MRLGGLCRALGDVCAMKVRWKQHELDALSLDMCDELLRALVVQELHLGLKPQSARYEYRLVCFDTKYSCGLSCNGSARISLVSVSYRTRTYLFPRLEVT